MARHRIRKGLNLPIVGAPVQEIGESVQPGRVALLASDYPGLRPTMHVNEGDEVRRGQLLFEDKKIPGVRFTSPGAGRVSAINRGDRRAFQSIVIDLSADERSGRSGGPEEASFSAFTGKHPNGLFGHVERELLVESGFWTALRARPFGRVADPEQRPHSIFVTAMDTNPLSASVDTALEGRHGDFERGVLAMAQLTDGPVYVCTAPDSTVSAPQHERVRHEHFIGPHPAGTVGVHIHTLDPVHRQKTVWYLGYQDAVAIGKLFETGKLHLERIVAVGGPVVLEPRLLRTRLGGSTEDVVSGLLAEGENRIISGSVFSGTNASGPVFGYLGRYHLQISALPEGRNREFLGWLVPGLRKYSVTRTFMSKLVPGARFAFTTSTNGSRRAIVPIGTYESVMPMDIMPTFLLRALLMKDAERAEELGCLELDEEDLALCTFVCPGKNDYGPHLREVLTTIEKEG